MPYRKEVMWVSQSISLKMQILLKHDLLAWQKCSLNPSQQHIWLTSVSSASPTCWVTSSSQSLSTHSPRNQGGNLTVLLFSPLLSASRSHRQVSQIPPPFSPSAPVTTFVLASQKLSLPSLIDNPDTLKRISHLLHLLQPVYHGALFLTQAAVWFGLPWGGRCPKGLHSSNPHPGQSHFQKRRSEAWRPSVIMSRLGRYVEVT